MLQTGRTVISKLKSSKTTLLVILLLSSLTLSLIQVTTPYSPSFHNGWMVTAGDKIQYSVAYNNTADNNSFVDVLINTLNLSTTSPLKLIIGSPIVSSDNLTELASHILELKGTMKFYIETYKESVNTSYILLPIAIPIVNWDNLIGVFNQIESSYINVTSYYSFFEKRILLNVTQKTATTTTTFLYAWSTDFGILESFYCNVITPTQSENLLLEKTQQKLNYKNELRGRVFYILDYGIFLVPAVCNFFIPLFLFSLMDYGEKGIFNILLKKLRFWGKNKKDDRNLSEYTFLLLVFIGGLLIYGFFLGQTFKEIPEYKYIPMFSLQIIIPLMLGLILSAYEINILNISREEGTIVIIYPCYSYITGVATSDLLGLFWEMPTLFLIFPVALGIVIVYHINKIRRRIYVAA